MPTFKRSLIAAFSPIILILSLAACRGPQDEVALIQFTSEPGRFHVQFPSSISNQQLVEYTIPKLLLGEEVQCIVTVSRDNSALWTVQFCDVPDGVYRAADPSALIDWARDDALATSNARLDREDPTVIADGCAGQNLTGRANMRGDFLDGTFKARVCLLGSRLYTIAAEIYDGVAANKLELAAPFLDSLFIDKDLSIPYETPRSE